MLGPKYYNLYSRIEKNLIEINDYEEILKSSIHNKETEHTTNSEETISRKIGAIESLIEENKQLVMLLKSKVNEKNKKLIKYNQLIDDLNKRVEKYKIKIKENTLLNDSITGELINLLNDKIALNITLEEKESLIKLQKVLIDEQTEELIRNEELIKSAFYIVNSTKNLKNAKIICNEGGVLGIGSRKKLNNNIDNNTLIKIDKKENTLIPIFSKNAELITSHDNQSYNWIIVDDKIQWLKINDPELFWKKSNHLIISTQKSTPLEIANKNK